MDILKNFFVGRFDTNERLVSCLQYCAYFVPSENDEKIPIEEISSLFEKGLLYKGTIELGDSDLVNQLHFLREKFSEFDERVDVIDTPIRISKQTSHEVIQDLSEVMFSLLYPENLSESPRAITILLARHNKHFILVHVMGNAVQLIVISNDIEIHTVYETGHIEEFTARLGTILIGTVFDESTTSSSSQMVELVCLTRMKENEDGRHAEEEYEMLEYSNEILDLTDLVEELSQLYDTSDDEFNQQQQEQSSTENYSQPGVDMSGAGDVGVDSLAQAKQLPLPTAQKKEEVKEQVSTISLTADTTTVNAPEEVKPILRTNSMSTVTSAQTAATATSAVRGKSVTTNKAEAKGEQAKATTTTAKSTAGDTAATKGRPVGPRGAKEQQQFSKSEAPSIGVPKGKAAAKADPAVKLKPETKFEPSLTITPSVIKPRAKPEPVQKIQPKKAQPTAAATAAVPMPAPAATTNPWMNLPSPPLSNITKPVDGRPAVSAAVDSKKGAEVLPPHAHDTSEDATEAFPLHKVETKPTPGTQSETTEQVRSVAAVIVETKQTQHAPQPPAPHAPSADYVEQVLAAIESRRELIQSFSPQKNQQQQQKVKDEISGNTKKDGVRFASQIESGPSVSSIKPPAVVDCDSPVPRPAPPIMHRSTLANAGGGVPSVVGEKESALDVAASLSDSTSTSYGGLDIEAINRIISENIAQYNQRAQNHDQNLKEMGGGIADRKAGERYDDSRDHCDLEGEEGEDDDDDEDDDDEDDAGREVGVLVSTSLRNSYNRDSQRHTQALAQAPTQVAHSPLKIHTSHSQDSDSNRASLAGQSVDGRLAGLDDMGEVDGIGSFSDIDQAVVDMDVLLGIHDDENEDSDSSDTELEMTMAPRKALNSHEGPTFFPQPIPGTYSINTEEAYAAAGRNVEIDALNAKMDRMFREKDEEKARQAAAADADAVKSQLTAEAKAVVITMEKTKEEDYKKAVAALEAQTAQQMADNEAFIIETVAREKEANTDENRAAAPAFKESPVRSSADKQGGVSHEDIISTAQKYLAEATAMRLRDSNDRLSTPVFVPTPARGAVVIDTTGDVDKAAGDATNAVDGDVLNTTSDLGSDEQIDEILNRLSSAVSSASSSSSKAVTTALPTSPMAVTTTNITTTAAGSPLLDTVFGFQKYLADLDGQLAASSEVLRRSAEQPPVVDVATLEALESDLSRITRDISDVHVDNTDIVPKDTVKTAVEAIETRLSAIDHMKPVERHDNDNDQERQSLHETPQSTSVSTKPSIGVTPVKDIQPRPSSRVAVNPLSKSLVTDLLASVDRNGGGQGEDLADYSARAYAAIRNKAFNSMPSNLAVSQGDSLASSLLSVHQEPMPDEKSSGPPPAAAAVLGLGSGSSFRPNVGLNSPALRPTTSDSIDRKQTRLADTDNNGDTKSTAIAAALAAGGGVKLPSSDSDGDMVSVGMAVAGTNPLTKSLVTDLLASVAVNGSQEEEDLSDYITRAYAAIRDKAVQHEVIDKYVSMSFEGGGLLTGGGRHTVDSGDVVEHVFTAVPGVFSTATAVTTATVPATDAFDQGESTVASRVLSSTPQDTKAPSPAVSIVSNAPEDNNDDNDVDADNSDFDFNATAMDEEPDADVTVLEDPLSVSLRRYIDADEQEEEVLLITSVAENKLSASALKPPRSADNPTMESNEITEGLKTNVFKFGSAASRYSGDAPRTSRDSHNTTAAAAGRTSVRGSHGHSHSSSRSSSSSQFENHESSEAAAAVGDGKREDINTLLRDIAESLSGENKIGPSDSHHEVYVEAEEEKDSYEPNRVADDYVHMSPVDVTRGTVPDLLVHEDKVVEEGEINEQISPVCVIDNTTATAVGSRGRSAAVDAQQDQPEIPEDLQINQPENGDYEEKVEIPEHYIQTAEKIALRKQMQTNRLLMEYQFMMAAKRKVSKRVAMGEEVLQMLRDHDSRQAQNQKNSESQGGNSPEENLREERMRRKHQQEQKKKAQQQQQHLQPPPAMPRPSSSSSSLQIETVGLVGHNEQHDLPPPPSTASTVKYRNDSAALRNTLFSSGGASPAHRVTSPHSSRNSARPTAPPSVPTAAPLSNRLSARGNAQPGLPVPSPRGFYDSHQQVQPPQAPPTQQWSAAPDSGSSRQSYNRDYQFAAPVSSSASVMNHQNSDSNHNRGTDNNSGYGAFSVDGGEERDYKPSSHPSSSHSSRSRPQSQSSTNANAQRRLSHKIEVGFASDADFVVVEKSPRNVVFQRMPPSHSDQQQQQPPPALASPNKQVIMIPSSNNAQPTLQQRPASVGRSRRLSAAAQEDQAHARSPTAVISESDLRRERIRAASAGRSRIGGGAAVASKYTNVQQIKNAITNICLAGSHSENKRNEVMDILDFYSSSSGKGVGAFRSLAAVEASLIKHERLKGTVNQFLIMFSKSKVQVFKAIYAIDPSLGFIFRIYGSGPRELPASNTDTSPHFAAISAAVLGYMKYETSGKCFKDIPVKAVSNTVDAIILDPTKLQKAK